MTVRLGATRPEVAPVTSPGRVATPAPTRPARRSEIPSRAPETHTEPADVVDRRIRALASAFAMGDEADLAYSDLHHALALAKERGQQVPCQGSNGEAWTSDDEDDQEVAAHRCSDCPALILCRQYADVAGVTGGVWGGRVAVPKRKSYDKPLSDEAREQRNRRARDRRAARKKARSDKELWANVYACFTGVEGSNIGSNNERTDTPMDHSKTPAEYLGPTGKYRPGMDARHASDVARAVAENPRRAKALMATLPSDALRAKAQRQIDRIVAKAKAKVGDKDAA